MERDLVYDAIVEEIGRVGGTIDGERPAKGGHRLVYWTTPAGAKIASTVQAYSGNWRSIKNARAHVRTHARRTETQS